MRAITVRPSTPSSEALEDVPDPVESDGDVLVETLAVGICGTDREIIAGEHGEAPPGQDRLVIGHESLGRVVDAPADSTLAAGDLVVAMVRHPDPVPCANCAVGEWDMCRNGQYTEHGIKGLDGFARERFRVDADRLIPVDPALGELGVLLEPTSIVAKAWEHIERIGQRAHWAPRRVLVTGAGPIGLLAAMLARAAGFRGDGARPRDRRSQAGARRTARCVVHLRRRRTCQRGGRHRRGGDGCHDRGGRRHPPHARERRSSA